MSLPDLTPTAARLLLALTSSDGLTAWRAAFAAADPDDVRVLSRLHLLTVAGDYEADHDPTSIGLPTSLGVHVASLARECQRAIATAQGRPSAIGVALSGVDDPMCDHCSYGPLPDDWQTTFPLPAWSQTHHAGAVTTTLCGFCYRSHAASKWAADGDRDRDAVDAAMRANLLRTEMLAVLR